MKNSKNKLVMGAVSVAMCGALLTGGTLAYFTKTVESTGNTIATKHFDVDVQQEKGKFDGKIQAGESVTNEVTVYNKGELDFVYSLNIVPSQDQGTFSKDLQKVINVTVDDVYVGTLEDVLSGSVEPRVYELQGGTSSLPYQSAVHKVTLTLNLPKDEPVDADKYSGKSVGNFDIEVVANEVVSK